MGTTRVSVVGVGMGLTSYAEFLAAKAQLAGASGLEIDPGEVHPILKPVGTSWGGAW